MVREGKRELSLFRELNRHGIERVRRGSGLVVTYQQARRGVHGKLWALGWRVPGLYGWEKVIRTAHHPIVLDIVRRPLWLSGVAGRAISASEILDRPNSLYQ